jgi:hypothetical protein
MGGPCRTHEGDEKFVQNLDSVKGTDHSEDLGVDGNNTEKDLREYGWIGFIWLTIGAADGIL